MSAFEFGVHNAMLGVKKMLALIWSREASIKVGNKPEMKCCYNHTKNGSLTFDM